MANRQCRRKGKEHHFLFSIFKVNLATVLENIAVPAPESKKAYRVHGRRSPRILNLVTKWR
jgi:hypothetical protein